MNDERRLAWRWLALTMTLALALLLAGLVMTLPVLVLVEQGVSLATLSWVEGYFATLLPYPDYWWAVHRQWLGDAVAGGRIPWALACGPLLAGLAGVLGTALNPYSTLPTMHGSARWAGPRDLRRMALDGGFVIVLGRWRGRLLQLPETLSALCIAPPGTGKTAAVVVPTILSGDGLSMVINDIKPELHQLTSGYRQTLGPVYRLDWAAVDDAARGIRHPRWNPLSPRSMPPAGPHRDLYVDRLANILIADPAGGADPHWSKRARAALAGFVHFLLSKCEAGHFAGLPAVWQDREACFPMLVDWLAAATADVGQAVQDPGMSPPADPLQEVLLAAVEEARQFGYAHRAFLELSQLAGIPDRERGSILSTMDAALTVFKNAAVRERTVASDFDFADFRGMRDPRWASPRPVTVYLTLSQANARALGLISGLFIEALSAYLIAHPPGGLDWAGRQSGPYPGLFVLDEFPQMPKLQALIDGPAVGRGQKLSYLLIGQDFAQIEEKYGKTGLETLLSTTAAKIILPLNNEAVAKRFSDMVGPRTLEARTKGRLHGWSKQVNPFAETINRSLTGVPLIHPADFMAMPAGTHVVLMQKFINRPIRAATVFYFKDRVFRRRCHGGGGGPAPALPLPPWLRDRR
ncbi:MAG TPA: type IV secretory system conjugative DNA transfer family protein [Rhodospirillaceae bacterium]|nr:type IV secretory system conjugative DNA transfer family protein [Rhodospirillaceae bacterium]